MDNYAPALTVEEFNALPKGEQRRAVARDGLEQIELGRIEPGEMYIRVAIPRSEDDGSKDLRQYLIREATVCRACALGTVFMSAVCLGDNIAIPNAGLWSRGPDALSYETTSYRMREHLDALFGEGHLYLIEAAYEGWLPDTWGDNSIDMGDKVSAFHFGQQHRTRDERLKAILTLMANHPEGLFVPPTYTPGSEAVAA